MDPKVRSKITSSTQDHLEIRDIVNDLVITKANSVSLVIETNAVNFDLLSEQEQINKITAFSGLLNSLSFPIQILITTTRIDITKYLDYLRTKEKDAMSEGLKRQLKIYEMFVDNLIIQNNVLDKDFYIVVSHYSTGNISNPVQIAKSQKGSVLFSKEKLVDRAKAQLYFKRDQVIKQLVRMGLTGAQLNTARLIDLFYDVYNPEE
jgi:hypothetical protein